MGGSDQSRWPGARGGEITQHEGPGMFSSQGGRNLKSTLLKCSETSQYENTNTDHRHGTDELGRVTGPREDAQMLQTPRTVEGRGGEGACKDSQRGRAWHTIHCAWERFRTGQLGSQSSGCRFGRDRALGSVGWGWGGLGSKGWRILTRHPAPELQFLHS